MTPDRAAALIRRLRSVSFVRDPGPAWAVVREAVDELELQETAVASLELRLPFSVSPALTFGRALAFLDLLVQAGRIDGTREQIEFMDTFPPALGVEFPNGLATFNAAHELVSELHRTLVPLVRQRLFHVIASGGSHG